MRSFSAVLKGVISPEIQEILDQARARANACVDAEKDPAAWDAQYQAHASFLYNEWRNNNAPASMYSAEFVEEEREARAVERRTTA